LKKECKESILKKHLELLEKNELSLEEIRFLFKNIPSKENLSPEDKKLIDKIINLAEEHKRKLMEKIKDNLKSMEAKRKYEASKFEFYTFSRRI